MSANDALQRVSDAVGVVVDTDAAVQAITGRSTNNIARYGRRAMVPPLPRLAYLATDAQIRIGTGENYDVTVVLRAEAATATVANALLNAAFRALTPGTFDGAGADAAVMEQEFTNMPDDSAGGGASDAPSLNKAVVLAEATLTVWITL